MYKNWEETITFGKFYWYSVSNLVTFLHELRSLVISNHSAKTIALRLSSLENKVLPASKYKRFPENDAYLCEGIGNLTERLDRLNLAVNVLVNPQRLERKYTEYKTVGEVEMYVLKSINQLLCELDQNTEMTITREAFESRNRLTWIDSGSANSTSFQTTSNEEDENGTNDDIN